MKNLSKDELKNISEKLSSQSIYSNNHKLVFRSKHYDHLIIGLSLAFANHSRARSYSIDPKLGLILYWLEDKGQYPLGPKSVSGPLKIPDGLGAFEVGEYVWDWLQKMKLLKKEQLEKLTTVRLLTYKNKLMSVWDHPNWEREYDKGLSKEDPDWKQAYQDLKEVLKLREHIERK